MHLADKCGKHVALFEVEVVAGAIEVGGHDANKVGAVLQVVAFAHFDARYLGNRVGLVGILKLRCQKISYNFV